MKFNLYRIIYRRYATVKASTLSPLQPKTKIKHRRLVQTLYKCILNESKDLCQSSTFFLRLPITLDEWGRGNMSISPGCQKSMVHTATELFPFITSNLVSLDTYPEHINHPNFLKRFIRDAFRNGSIESCEDKTQKLVDEAFGAMREISRQRIMNECSSVTITEGIKISATAQALMPNKGIQRRHRFSYRIHIENLSKSTVQIISRAYKFEDERGSTIHVPKGSPGIVGCTPILKPGEGFVYCSGVDLMTSTGTAEGSLQVVRKNSDGEEESIDALVSKFKFLQSN